MIIYFGNDKSEFIFYVICKYIIDGLILNIKDKCKNIKYFIRNIGDCM